MAINIRNSILRSLIIGGLPSYQNITDVWAVKQSLNGETLELPAHDANDTIIVFARGPYPGPTPTLPLGWTTVVVSEPDFANNFLVCSAKDVTNTLTSITLVNAFQVFAVCYRGVDSLGTGLFTNFGPANSANFPTISPITAPGVSRVYSAININQGTANFVVPVELTRRLDNLIPSLGGGEIGIFDSDDVTTFNSVPVSWTPGAYGSLMSVELIPVLV